MTGSDLMNAPPSRRSLAPAVAALACGLALALPFWVGRLVPLLDLPQHLAVVAVLRHHDDPAWGFARYFETEWGELTPYWTFYLLTYLASLAVPVETAGRLVLSLYALAFPWAGMSLARAFGRPPWVGLLAAPLALNTNLYFGFVSYCGAALLMLFLLAEVRRSEEDRRAWRAVALAFGTVVLFFTHVQVFAFFVAAAASVVATDRASTWRTRMGRVMPLVPAVLFAFLPWLYRETLAGRRGAAGEHDFGRVGEIQPSFKPIDESLLDLPSALAGSFQDRSDTWMLVGWIVLLSYAQPRMRQRAALPMVLAAAAYFAAPVAITGQWNIGPRFAWLAALLVVPLVTVTGRQAVGVGVAAVALTAGASWNAARVHAAFDRELGPFDAALETIPRGVRVMPLVFEPRGRILDKWPYLHIGQYAMVRRGGMAAFNLGRIASFPIRLRDRRQPFTDVFRPADFDFQKMGGAYDYFLLRGGAWKALFPVDAVDVVFERGDWTVLRRRFDTGGASDRIPVSSRTQ